MPSSACFHILTLRIRILPFLQRFFFMDPDPPLPLLTFLPIPVLWIRNYFLRIRIRIRLYINFGINSEIIFFAGSGSGFSINFGFGLGSGFSITFGSGIGSRMFLQTTLEFTLFLLKVQRILHPYLNCRSCKLCQNFFLSVQFYRFVFM